MKWWKKKRRKKKGKRRKKGKKRERFIARGAISAYKRRKGIGEIFSPRYPMAPRIFCISHFSKQTRLDRLPWSTAHARACHVVRPQQGKKKKIKNKKKEERKKRNGERRIWKEEPDNRKFIDRSRCSTRFRSFKLHCLQRAVNLPINPLRFILRFFFSLIFTIISIFTSINTKNINTRTRGHLGT